MEVLLLLALNGYFGVVTHVRRGEVLTCKVGDPITSLIVMHCDKADLISVKGVEDLECSPTAVAMGRQSRWLNAVAQEEGITPFLRP